MDTLKDRLIKFRAAHKNWLPSYVDMVLTQPWGCDDVGLQKAIDSTDYSKIPNDGSCGSLTPNERAFIREFQS